MTDAVQPRRGDVWIANFSPTVGREQAGVRMCVVLSVDRFNRSPAELVLVCPTTTRERKIPTHVRVTPPEGGLREMSFVKCEDLRSVSKERLQKRLGTVSPETMREIETRVRLILGL
jgi:mRNA interferase MazF